MTEPTFHSLAEAVEAYYDELKSFAAQRIGSASRAADVLQEAWIRAATTTAAAPDNPRSYLYRMVANLLVDQLRRDRAQQRVVSDEPIPVELASPAPGPDRIVSGRQEMTVLMAAVDELPDKCRQVFLLYRGKNLTMREIAARLGITEKTVEKHIARAMLHCRRRMHEAGGIL